MIFGLRQIYIFYFFLEKTETYRQEQILYRSYTVFWKQLLIQNSTISILKIDINLL